MKLETADDPAVSCPAVPGHANMPVPNTPPGAFVALGAPATPFSEALAVTLQPGPMTPGLCVFGLPAPMTPGLPALSAPTAAKLAPLANSNNIQLTQPLAPPVSREAGCFLIFEAAHCDLARDNIMSSLIICL